MCGRYRLSRRAEILASYFYTEYEGMDWEARYNIAPTQTVPVIRQDAKEPVRRASLMRWGLVPNWAKDATIGARMNVTTFNTRIWQFPEFYMAFLMRLKPREMFKVSDADSQPAKVKFAGTPMSSVERNAQLTEVMKDELLDLEGERQRGSVTPEEYTEAKTALEEIMKRRAARSGGGQGS